MKRILRIARLELATLFYSPVAWLVLIVFTIQCGVTFADVLGRYLGYQMRGSNLSLVTGIIFYNPPAGGLFPTVQEYLFLYIPLLTMGLISRELSSGSIKLLLSSPVKITEIVLGKFASMMAYGLILVGVLGSFGIAGLFSIEALDIGFILSGLLGLYLLICAFAAIGLFMSSLTSYQSIAAISTLVVLAALSYIGTVGQGIDFVRDLTYFLSILGRVNDFINGLISSKDLIYFLLVIGLFLGLTILKLQSERKSKSATVHTGRYVLLVCLVLMIGYISSRPVFSYYYDMTRTNWRTLTPNSQEVVAQMNGTLKMTTYANLLDRFMYYVYPEQRNRDLSRFEQYIRFKPRMETEYVYYYDTSKSDHLYENNPGLDNKALAKKVADSRGLDLDRFLSSEEIKQLVDLEPEENRISRKLEYDGKETFLRMFSDGRIYPGESEITAALKRLIVIPPKIGLLTGHGERSLEPGDANYKQSTIELTYRQALINQGFDVSVVSLDEGSIPEDMTILVIADPRREFSAEERARMDQYIQRGGNLMIAGEPGGQQLLNPVLASLGIQLKEGSLLQKNEDLSNDIALAGVSRQAADLSDSFKESFENKRNVLMAGASELEQTTDTDYIVYPLLTVDAQNTWNSLASAAKPAAYHAVAEETNSISVAFALTRPAGDREQRIVVLGDADFMSTRELERRYYNSNKHFYLEIMQWLSYGEFPIDTSRPDNGDNTILVSRDGLFTLRALFMGILPALTLLGGGMLLISRKRK